MSTFNCGGDMEQGYYSSFKGQFLLAMPGMNDPNFAHTVTCICEHSAEGAVGITVNRVHPALSAKNIFEELRLLYTPQAGALPIHLGGPVHIDEIFMLHGPPFNWLGCLMITPYLAMSNTIDILKAVAAGKGPKSLMIALGCSGWGPYQLESEIGENTWLTSPLSCDIIFDTDIEQRWKAAIRKMGINPMLLSEAAGHA